MQESFTFLTWFMILIPMPLLVILSLISLLKKRRS